MNPDELLAWAKSSKPVVSVVFTDIVGSTLLAKENNLDEDEMAIVRQAHFAQADRLLALYGGLKIKTNGDEHIAIFHEASASLRFAVSFHGDTGDHRVKIRAGIHFGTVRIENGDIAGPTVDLSSRIEHLAKTDEIWISDDARRAIEREGIPSELELDWLRHSGLAIKGFDEETSAWSIKPQDDASDETKLPSTVISSTAKYVITNLGTLGGDISRARAINNCGVIVGESRVGNRKDSHAFLFSAPSIKDLTLHSVAPKTYESARMRDLGALGPTNSTANDINDSGVIVGMTTTPSSPATGGPPYSAFIYRDGTMRNLGTLGGNESQASSINGCGIVVGSSEGPRGNENESVIHHGFIWFAGRMHELGSLRVGGHTWASKVNEAGVVVGSSQAADGEYHAFRFVDGEMTDLGTLGGKTSAASDINDHGYIVGRSDGRGGMHAFIHDDNGMHDLGALAGGSSEAYSINNRGEVVGRSAVPSGGHHAFLFREGRMLDLNDLIPAGAGWVLTEAIDINNDGQIVGNGYLDGAVRAFLLTPMP
jgi:probable HAF family extracellular repeat protein